MNYTESLLQDFQDMTVFEMYGIIIVLVMLGFVLGFGFTLWINRNEKTYKQGQIDAINGKINYEKKENDDGEMVWVEK